MIIENSMMKDAVRRLNTEYGLNLTEEEIEAITRQAEAGQAPAKDSETIGIPARSLQHVF